jgi:proline dehydrogenase
MWKLSVGIVGYLDNKNIGAAAAAAAQAAASSTDNQALSRDRKEIVQLVKKNWHSTHVECSAKYNWNIVTIFRELATTLDMIANGQIIGEQKNTTRKKRCLVF